MHRLVSRTEFQVGDCPPTRMMMLLVMLLTTTAVWAEISGSIW